MTTVLGTKPEATRMRLNVTVTTPACVTMVVTRRGVSLTREGLPVVSGRTAAVAPILFQLRQLLRRARNAISKADGHCVESALNEPYPFDRR